MQKIKSITILKDFPSFWGEVGKAYTLDEFVKLKIDFKGQLEDWPEYFQVEFETEKP